MVQARSAGPDADAPGAPAGAAPEDRAGAPLVGRDGARARVAQFLDEVPSRGGALLVVGPGGSGRSALLAEAAREAGRQGIRVVRLAGVRDEATFPDAFLDRLLALLPDRAQPHEPDSPGALATADAVAAAVRDALRTAPLLLVVDDLHLVDRSSARVLRELVEEGAGTRPGHAGRRPALLAATADAATAAWAPGVGLAALPDSVARTLLRQRHPSLPRQVVDRLVAEAEGNPLLLVELPAALTPQQADGSAELPATLRLTPRLSRVFQEELGRLPAPTRALLLRVALGASRSLPPSAWGATHPDAADDRAGGLLRSDSRGHLAFTHPLFRLAVLDSSTGAERRAAHLELADEEPDLVRRAWHLAAASVRADIRVHRELSRAAQVHLARGEAATAVAALVRAAELSPSPDAESRSLAHAAYLAAVATGDLERTAELLTRARDIAGPDAPLWAFLAEAQRLLHVAGDVDAARRSVSAALAVLAPAERRDPRALARALREEVAIEALAMRPISAAVVDRATEGAGAAEARSVRLLAGLMDPAGVGPPDRSDLDTAIAELAEESDPAIIGRVAGAAMVVDRSADCRPALLRLATADGQAEGVTAMASMLLAMDDWLAGRWSEVARRCAEGLAFAEPHGDRLRRAQFQCLAAWLAAARGDRPAVRRICADVESWAVRQDVGALVSWCRLVRSLDAMGSGDHEAAFQHALAVASARPRSGGRAQTLWASLDLVEAALRTGRSDAARSHVEHLLEDPLTPLSPRSTSVLPACRALLAPPDRAAGFFRDALGSPALVGFPFEHARIRLLHGEWLRRTRARREAREELDVAVELFAALGAHPWTRRARAELEAAGSTTSRGRSPRPDGLTAQQSSVAHLAAAGLSNADIAARMGLSRRTVAAHLAAAFRTLDVANRAALRDSLGPSHATAGTPG